MVLLVTLVCLMFTPESPRYRAEKGRVEDAHRILERFHGTAFADAAIIEINEAIALEHAASKNVGYADCFSKCVSSFCPSPSPSISSSALLALVPTFIGTKSDPSYLPNRNDQCFRYRTLLAVGVNMAQQLTGINMATYCGPYVPILKQNRGLTFSHHFSQTPSRSSPAVLDSPLTAQHSPSEDLVSPASHSVSSDALC